MAYRRCLSTRVSLLRERFHPSFSYIAHGNDDDSKNQQQHHVADKCRPAGNRGYHSSSFNHGCTGFGSLFQERRSLLSFGSSATIGSSFHRYSTSSSGGGEDMNSIGEGDISGGATAFGEGSDTFGYVADVAEVLSDKTMEIVTSTAPIVSDVLSDKTVGIVTSTAPVVSEVSLAAAESYFPVAALQYLIDGFHNILPMGAPLPDHPNWWLAIVLSTLLIRTATVPLLIEQLKSTSKLTLLRPRLEEIKNQMNDSAEEPISMAEGQKRMMALFTEYGVTPFTPLKGILIQGPIFISFYLAITNMVEKMPSFKEGGAFWFTDLTTPDPMYILPALTALTFLISVEFNMQDGMQGNPAAQTMKKVSRAFAVLMIPLTASFPKAIFCYWITSNVFTLFYGLVIKLPAVRKLFNIPTIDMPPPTTGPQPAFSLFSSSKPSSLSEKLRILQEQVKAKDAKSKSDSNE
ncbi:hypothetical protein MKW94_022628 [Papaver nudicaule]|uniref:Membrane insertase YidC/Oxa/ALB C-terminal domain-containing protein n=1 Tax=Papaver nudicaule TaxID=74823 RepID=A0AA41UY19_PAPNU|nr:hypothetical protein [Papaver nudicaule]